MPRPADPAIDQALQNAAKLTKRGDLDAAKRLYDQILAREPGNKKARKALKALQREGKHPLSVADLERIGKMMEARQFKPALADLRRLCRAHPEQQALHNLRGVALVELREPVAALEAFEQAISLKADFIEAINNLGATLNRLRRFPEAIDCYKRLIERGEADAEVYLNLGLAQRDAGQLDEAQKAFAEALRLNPMTAGAHAGLGRLLNQRGEHESAQNAFNAALRIEPRHRDARLGLAQTLIFLRRFEAAARAYDEVLADHPKDPDALRGAANCMNTLQQKDAARELYRRLLAVEPDNQVARHMLAAYSGQAIKRAHPDYAMSVFESYADTFEEHLTQTLGYSLPMEIPALLESLDGEDAWYPRVVDLGCGTGLVGLQIRSYCDHLSGVDVSPGMLEKAAEKAVYDELIAQDLETMMRSARENFDLIVCADVLLYVGELGALFDSIARRANPGAHMILSTESYEGTGFTLRESGRFAHSQPYVESCAQAAGFALTRRTDIQLRKELGNWIPGDLFVFTRSDAA
ncbi:MAG: tetratricopeptide repeat protein [Congregibacter sp.]